MLVYVYIKVLEFGGGLLQMSHRTLFDQVDFSVYPELGQHFIVKTDLKAMSYVIETVSTKERK